MSIFHNIFPIFSNVVFFFWGGQKFLVHFSTQHKISRSLPWTWPLFGPVTHPEPAIISEVKLMLDIRCSICLQVSVSMKKVVLLEVFSQTKIWFTPCFKKQKMCGCCLFGRLQSIQQPQKLGSVPISLTHSALFFSWWCSEVPVWWDMDSFVLWRVSQARNVACSLAAIKSLFTSWTLELSFEQFLLVFFMKSGMEIGGEFMRPEFYPTFTKLGILLMYPTFH